MRDPAAFVWTMLIAFPQRCQYAAASRSGRQAWQPMRQPESLSRRAPRSRMNERDAPIAQVLRYHHNFPGVFILNRWTILLAALAGVVLPFGAGHAQPSPWQDRASPPPGQDRGGPLPWQNHGGPPPGQDRPPPEYDRSGYPPDYRYGGPPPNHHRPPPPRPHMPPPRREARPPPPHARHTWRWHFGHWDWRGRWVWIPGRWYY
jgi:hypothetical protein